MRRILLCILVTLACAGGAFASAYDDFARGVSANARGDSPTAIEAFTAALAGDLTPNLIPSAHFGRAIAYGATGACGKSLMDLDAAVTLKPNYWDAISLRGDVHVCLNDDPAALADYATVIASHPGPQVYKRRGHLWWSDAQFASAASDFAQAARLEPSDAYDVLWFAMAQSRAGALDPVQVKDMLDKVSSSKWPWDILRLYAGRSTPQDVAAAVADDDSGTTQTGRQCEADFYTAEWMIGRGDAAGSVPLLDRAVAGCPHGFIEYGAAKLERSHQKSQPVNHA